MLTMRNVHILQAKDFFHELVFTTSRSSGPGGQNVNKVNSKVTVKFDVLKSSALSPEQKEQIIKRLASRMTLEGVLHLTSQENRSQIQNREDVVSKLNDLLLKVFTPRKVRKPTNPSKAAKRARIKAKKRRSEKKQWRQKP